MMQHVTARIRSSVLLLAGLAIGACADNDLTAPQSMLRTEANSTTPPGYYLTKRGPLGTTATFSISATGGSLVLGSTVTLDACPEDGSVVCTGTLVWVPTSDDLVQVTVTEIATTGGTVFDQIAASRTMDGVTEFFGVFAPNPPTITLAMNGNATANVRFKNIEDEEPPTPLLRVVKTAGNPVVNVGSPMSFDITVYSDGPGTAENVTLNDPLPGGVGISWATTSAGCTITGAAPTQTLSCAFGDLAAGETRTVSVTGTTTVDAACAEYTNTVSVSADNHGTITSTATVELTGCTRDGFQGCTPGYWKQKHHFGNWTGFTTTQTYNSVFGVNLFSSSTTLLQALSTGGGGIYRFGRHSVAALLSSANSDVDYGMSAAQVIAAVQAAVASGDLKLIDKLADEFERRNERNCPLGRAD